MSHESLSSSASTAFDDAPWASPAPDAMREMRVLLERVARGTISVVLTGETGVGKEVHAEALHRASPRAHRPFLKLNCAVLSEQLFESELFGHERGAFTGATAAKPGLLEVAEGGTVFLDEVGELPLSIQVKLLRVLEERAVLPVGGLRARPIDVRFVAATNRDLEAEVARGAFREDLYYRLNGVALAIPPLRDRRGEIVPLARTFIDEAWHQLGNGGPAPVLSRAALAALEAHAWPGNVRELRNTMNRTVLICPGRTIGPEHLGLVRPVRRTPPPPTARLSDIVAREVEVVEHARILDALARSRGNQTSAARLLGVSRATLVKRLDQYDIERPRKRTARLA